MEQTLSNDRQIAYHRQQINPKEIPDTGELVLYFMPRVVFTFTVSHMCSNTHLFVQYKYWNTNDYLLNPV